MKQIDKSILLKASAIVKEDISKHQYEVIEVESGYIYHSHVFNTSTFVPFKPAEPQADPTLTALRAIFSTWNPKSLDADTMYAQISQLTTE